MSVLTERKIDAHCHVLDPARFPYGPDVAYRPAGQEMGDAERAKIMGGNLMRYYGEGFNPQLP